MISFQNSSTVVTEVIRGILISKIRMVMAMANTPSQNASRRALDVSFTIGCKSIQLRKFYLIQNLLCLHHHARVSLRANSASNYFPIPLVMSQYDTIG